MIRSKSSFASSRRQARTRRNRRLLFEQFECRRVLAGVWDGGGGDNNWHTAANWDDDLLPGAATDVSIGGAYSAITILSAADVMVSSVASAAGLSITGGTFTIANDSTFDGAVNLSGTATLALNTLTVGGAGAITNAATLNLAGSTLNVALANQGTLVVPSPDASTLGGALTTTAASTIRLDPAFGAASSLTVASGFTNNGLIELTGGDNALASLAVTSGTLTNSATGNIRSLLGGGTGFRTLTAEINNQGTLQIEHNLNVNQASADHVNSGTINIVAGSLTVNQSGTTPTFDNSGVINATGGSVFISGVGQTVSNSGSFNVASGRQISIVSGSLTNFSGGTLAGGTYNIAGTLRFPGAAIATNSATIVLDGAASQIVNEVVADALAGLAANTGNLTLQNGRSLAVAGGLANSGNVTLGTGSALATGAASNYTQTAGTTVLLDASSTLDPAGLVDIQGGSLSGIGLVAGNVQSQGQVVPGNSAAGVMSIGGDYSQSAAGGLQIELGGTAPTAFDQLSASGAVNLAGALNLALVGGFVPLLGNSFRVVNNTGAGATSGAFLGLAEGGTLTLGGQLLQITYAGGDGNDVVLAVVVPVNLAPTLDAISDPAAILEDAAAQTINLSGISAGLGESQTLTVTATSSNPGLIPDPTVTYASPNATGSLTYTPVANQSGSAVITVTVMDDGGTAGGGVNVTTRAFTVIVTAVNDAPTLDPIPDPAAIAENSGLQSVNLAGISAGGGESQTLSVTATSDNPGLIPNPTVFYTSANATGSLSFTPVAGQSGSAVITVTVMDDGGTADGGVNLTIRTFTVVVAEAGANVAPTLDAIPDPAAILEGAGLQTVNLAGISAGAGESQTLSVTATSSNPGLIPNPTVFYASANTTGSLTYTPVAGQSGSAVITVTVMDDGGTANGGVNLTTRTFTVLVTDVAVNLAPTLDAIPDPAAILEDAGLQTVNLTGISAGTGESQTLSVTATSSNPGLIPNPTVTYTSANATGSLTYAPVANQSGSAVITVTVMDDGGTAGGGVNVTTRTFTVNVTPVNDAPTLGAIPNPAPVEVEAGLQTVLLAGISAGPSETQTLVVAAVSSNPGLIPNPTVIYTSANATGSLTFTPVAGQSGTAEITVTVLDDGGTSGGGVNLVTRTFTVTVVPPAPDEFDISDTNSAAIVDDPAHPGRQALLVVGTSGKDIIVVAPGKKNEVRVKRCGKTIGNFRTNQFSRIVVFALEGEDKIIINAKIKTSAELHGGTATDFLFGGAGADLLFAEGGNDHLFGGKGNDRLFGSGGNDSLFGGSGNDRLFGGLGSDKLYGETGHDVLVGGEGDDKLYGGPGKDVLIGGDGSDRLQGQEDEDLQIGGTTTFDEDEVALLAILAEWTASRSQALRIRNLTDGTGTSAPRNDPFFLVPGDTVLDDGDRDDFISLNQGKKKDWRLA